MDARKLGNQHWEIQDRDIPLTEIQDQNTRVARPWTAWAGRRRKTGRELLQSPSRGAVTAEFAVVLPAVVFLLALLLAGAAAGVTQVRLEGAARAGARELARGGEQGAVAQTVRALAGSTAAAAITAEGGWSTVIVSDTAGGPLGSLIPWTLSATATARTEAAGRLTQGVGSVGT